MYLFYKQRKERVWSIEKRYKQHWVVNWHYFYDTKYSQTCIKWSPFRTKTNLPYKTGELLRDVKFISNFLWQDKKLWSLDTDDCLIEVTACTGVTVKIN